MKLFRLFLFLTPLVYLPAQTPAPKAAAPAKKTPAPAAKKAAAPAAQSQAQPAAPKPAAAKPAAAKPSASLTLPSDKVVITVGEEKITAAQFNRLISALPEQYRSQAASGAGRKQLIDNLIRMKVLAQEARRRKLDEDPEYLHRAALQREELLAATMFAALGKDGAGEDKVKQYYEGHRSEFDSVRASHILIRFKGSPVPLRQGTKELSEAEALAKVQALRQKIAAGAADFAEVARKESDDVGNGVQGGDLGPAFTRGRMVPSFEEVAFRLKPGELSQPVKTIYGYHLIKVTAREDRTFEQARAEIENKLRTQATEALHKSANIVIDPALAASAQ